MTSNLKSLLILLGFSLFAYGVYFVFTTYDVFSTAKTKAETVEMETARLEREVLSHLTQIAEIKFDETIFSREDYKSLKDLSVQLPQPRVSRPNPFADLP